MGNHSTVVAHTVTVEAPAGTVFDLVADVDQSTRFFPGVVHAESAERGADTGADTDVIDRWTLDGEVIRGWRARRTLDRAGGTITFEHVDPRPPVTFTTGRWRFTPDGDARTTVELRHEFGTADPAAAAAVAARMEQGITTQLDRLRQVAEQRDEILDLEITYQVSLLIKGRLEDVYDYFYDARQWPARIPHCLRTDVREDEPDRQLVEMEVTVPSGAVHVTRQARVCFPNDKIMWRQIGGLPPLDQALFGYTRFEQRPDGVLTTSCTTEVLKPAMVAKRGWTVQEAKDHVSEVRGGRNLGALQSAQDYLDRQVQPAGNK
ncbi:aromatase/cyclase [Virgisporangium aurantiacum]|uniref:Aromatase n=1 Tax=Virgisporangium aurantiacum TaxID=175570 RepID=A0A8J3ZEN4_9ACTN|nr:SRPBCC family protein [Virgisporangium aurantiacum]GIJ60405.1 hypothetical protein Vau01_079210 [Virgisporangium aurantiacum]